MNEFIDSLVKEIVNDFIDNDVDIENLHKIDNFDDIFTKALQKKIDEAAQIGLKEYKSSMRSLLRRSKKKQLGFEKRLRKSWKTALDLFELFLLQNIRIGQDFNDQVRPGVSKQNDFVLEVLLHLHARSCLIGFEVLTLLESGFADGAHARWRTLHEIAVVVYCINKYGNEAAERYLFHEINESYKAIIEYQKHCEKLGHKPYSDEKVKKIKLDYASMITRFGKEFGSSYGWASSFINKKQPNFTDIESDIGLDHMRPYYRMASHNVHANPKGIRYKLGQPHQNLGLLLAGPSAFGLADPGSATVHSMYQVLAILITTHITAEGLISLKLMEKLANETSEAFMNCHEKLDSKASSMSIQEMQNSAVVSQQLVTSRKSPGKVKFRIRSFSRPY